MTDTLNHLIQLKVKLLINSKSTITTFHKEVKGDIYVFTIKTLDGNTIKDMSLMKKINQLIKITIQ